SRIIRPRYRLKMEFWRGLHRATRGAEAVVFSPHKQNRLVWGTRIAQNVDVIDLHSRKPRSFRLGFPALEKAGGNPPSLRMTALRAYRVLGTRNLHHAVTFPLCRNRIPWIIISTWHLS